MLARNSILLSACGLAITLASACGATRTLPAESAPAVNPSPVIGGDNEISPGQPAHTATDTPTPEPVRSRLEHLFRALREMEAESPTPLRVHILQVGDSHTASDTFTAELRSRLQTRFGDGGRGYAFAGKPWRSFRQLSMSFDQGGDWQVSTVMRETNATRFGLGGLRMTPESPESWIERGSCNDCRFGREVAEMQILFDTSAGPVAAGEGATTAVDGSGSYWSLAIDAGETLALPSQEITLPRSAPTSSLLASPFLLWATK